MNTAAAALFLMPHHDDEVFCAGRIRQALLERRRVRILWATAGGYAPARVRQREGEHVAELLALQPEDHVSLGLPDQGALDHLDDLVRAAIRMLGGVEDVFVPAFEGGHPDHDALNVVAARLRAAASDAGEAAPRFWEFSLYRRMGRRVVVKAPFAQEPGPSERFLLGKEARALRQQLARANPSQWVELVSLATLAGRRWRSEPVRPLPAHDYSRPPSGEPPLYELYTRRRFDEFRAVACG